MTREDKATRSGVRIRQVAACRRLSAEGIVDRSELLKEIRAHLVAVNGQVTADGLGVTRQAVHKWTQGQADPSLMNTCLLARRFGYRVALVPAEEGGP